MKKTIIASTLALCLVAGFAYAGGHHGWRNSGSYPCMYNQQYGNGGQGAMMGQGKGWNRNNMRGSGPCVMGQGRMGGVGMWSNSATQQQFLQDTVALRKELHSKRFDLREARFNSTATPEQIATLEKELIDLQTQLNIKAQSYTPPAPAAPAQQ